MIDFEKNPAFVLTPAPLDGKNATETKALLLDDETIQYIFQGGRDSVAFTNKRIIALNVQGLTGKKKDFTSLPYSKIQAFSVESAGAFDRDAELEIWFSGLGKVKFEFCKDIDVSVLSKFIFGYMDK